MLEDLPTPQPGPGHVLVRVHACAVCRTDLHVVDGELPNPKMPLIPGHEVVGQVVMTGLGVDSLRAGDRVGIPWLGWTCGQCFFCRSGQENLCDSAKFTGYTLDGGYAEYCVADARYGFRLPGTGSAVELAPLLCAGLIGYRSLRMVGDASTLGFYGFGAAAHILVQVATGQGRRVFAFVRPGDKAAEQFALERGAAWAGGSDEPPPEPLDAAIIFAPVGALVPVALRAVRPGGIVVCAGIHMSDIPTFRYAWLWKERVIRSVANLTRRDGEEFFGILERHPVQTFPRTYRLEDGNVALDDLRAGRIQGAAVVVVGDGS